MLYKHMQIMRIYISCLQLLTMIGGVVYLICMGGQGNENRLEKKTDIKEALDGNCRIRDSLDDL